MLRFLADLPATQPNLFFASVQFLTGPDRMPAPGDELDAFVQHHGDELAALMRSRRTQTNEVGRCAVVLPALPAGPLALVEVGASAGLCLLLDRFHYDYGRAHVGDRSSPVRVRCTTSGPVPVPATPPRVAWRRGLDRHPLDVHDDDAVRWLLACVWPDHRERRERLAAAIGLARTAAPVVSRGDLVEDLAPLLAEVPSDAQLVVFHSAALTYVTAERRHDFASVLAAASNERDIVWLSNEAAGVVHDLPVAAPSRDQLQYVLGRARFSSGRRYDEILAVSHPHGAELTWL